MKHIVKSRFPIQCRPNFNTKLRPNFYQISTPPVSKFALNVYQTSTNLRHSGVEVWSNCGYVLVKIAAILYSKLWVFVDVNCGYVFVGANCGYQLVKIVNICWSIWCMFFVNPYSALSDYFNQNSDYCGQKYDYTSENKLCRFIGP